MNQNEITTKRREVSEELISDFSRLVTDWNLSDNEQQSLLGGCTINYLQTQFHKSETAMLSEPITERLVLLTSIGNDIKILYPEERRSGYINAPNKSFDGLSALEKMLRDDLQGILFVKKYLTSSILGGYL